MDYVTLKTTLPSPAHASSAQSNRHVAAQSFGHPAQDASDACTEIAWMLNKVEATLREHLGDLPAPKLELTEDGKLVNQSLLVAHAFKYLSSHFDQLCDWPAVGAHAGAVDDTHQTNRAKYGFTRAVDPVLPLPCPSCDVAALVRSVDKITCGNCGRVIREQDYPMLTRIAIDWALDDFEAVVAAEDAAST